MTRITMIALLITMAVATEAAADDLKLDGTRFVGSLRPTGRGKGAHKGELSFDGGKLHVVIDGYGEIADVGYKLEVTATKYSGYNPKTRTQQTKSSPVYHLSATSLTKDGVKLAWKHDGADHYFKGKVAIPVTVTGKDGRTTNMMFFGRTPD